MKSERSLVNVRFSNLKWFFILGISCVPVKGEGISVILMDCNVPVFTLDSNYCAEYFEVRDSEGTLVWNIVVPEDQLCIDALSFQGLEYGASVPGATTAEELIDEETYTFEADIESQIELPPSWQGSFTYSCYMDVEE